MLLIGEYYVEQGKGREVRMDRMARYAREAQGREDMDSEEAYMRHYLRVKIAKRKAEAERKRLEEQPKRPLREHSRGENRMLAEARAEAAKQPGSA